MYVRSVCVWKVHWPWHSRNQGRAPKSGQITRAYPKKIPVQKIRVQKIPQKIPQISDFIYTKNPARPGFGFYLHKELARDRDRIFSTQRIS